MYNGDMENYAPRIIKTLQECRYGNDSADLIRVDNHVSLWIDTTIDLDLDVACLLWVTINQDKHRYLMVVDGIHGVASRWVSEEKDHYWPTPDEAEQARILLVTTLHELLREAREDSEKGPGQGGMPSAPVYSMGDPQMN